MRRFVAIALMSTLGLVTPGFAQSTGPHPGVSAGERVANSQTMDGLDASAQVNRDDDDDREGGGAFGDLRPLLVIGGIAGAAGLLIYAATQNGNDNPVSP